MSSKKKQNSPSAVKAVSGLTDNRLSMFEKFSTAFTIGIFTLFPVFMTNKLFNVREDRLHFFIVSTLLLLFFILSTYICGIDKDKSPRKLFYPTLTDYSMIGFIVVCTLSAIFSKYGMESVTGSGGRDSGLILMAVYFLCYLLLSRYSRTKTFVFDIFVVASCAVSIIAVLHEFYVDPFNILTEIKEEQQSVFITTIGNKNLYSAFLCVCIPVAIVLLVHAKDIPLKIFYSVATGIGFMGMLVADSDSGYFGLGAFMLILLVYACGSAKKLFGYCLAVTSMIASCKIFRFVSYMFLDKMKPLDTIPQTLIFSNIVYILLPIAIAFTVGVYLLVLKEGDNEFPKQVRIIAACFVAVCFLAVLLPFVYFSFIDKETDLGKLGKYLRLNDQWGTHRGYAWIRSIILFKDNGIKNMLIGSGPDTFGQIIKEKYRQDMIKRHGSVFDSAHNEYLNYLVTIGITGLVAYVTAMISVVVRGFKHCKKSLPLLIIVFVIICYNAQSMFNIAQPITTPFLFVFLGLGEALIRKFELEEKQQ